MSVQPKVAVVTGAGTGIGRAVSLALVEDGYRVVLAGRRQKRLEQVAASVMSAKGRPLPVPTNVRDP